MPIETQPCPLCKQVPTLVYAHKQRYRNLITVSFKCNCGVNHCTNAVSEKAAFVWWNHAVDWYHEWLVPWTIEWQKRQEVEQQ